MPHVSLGHQTPWRWRGSAGPAVLCLTSALGTRHLDADVVQPDSLYYASRQPWAPDTLTLTWSSRTRCIMPHVSLGHQTPWRWRGPAGPAVICLTSALDTRHLDADVVQPDPLYYASPQPWTPDTLTVTWFSRTRCNMPHVSLGHQTLWRWRGPAGPAVICLTSALDTRHLDGDVVQPDPMYYASRQPWAPDTLTVTWSSRTRCNMPHVSLGHQTPWRWRGPAGPAVICLTSALDTRHLDGDVVQPDSLYYASRQPWAPDTLTVTWSSRTRCIMPHVSLGHQTPWRWRGPAGPAVLCLTSALDTRHLDADVVQPDPL